ncbi:ABC transporter permease subunit [Bacteriovorax stolpii]|uniref:Peptide ABC transporter permease n=1 Tax=Bacteriovorax stolpii TaxID=960 RepID=A0A2K9NNZ3_BACTC|nr:ABC transporter permease subunit [Bacteriovorax stolpii]AUN96795.1 peptide ABC transporter permease [Bacteriovorax stolpii]QDK43274.1 ABC transporter permease subunit [Bacteriovorax stolpii]TDP53072.1 microcin C transport system permease protein [Bacteriovorax stolpii]
MIERYITNELTRKRWKIFKKSKSAMISSFVLVFLILATFLSPFIANSRPLMISYHGTTYFPIFKDYNASDFGITDALDVDYRALQMGKGDYALWPIVQWDPFESNSKVDSYPSAPSETNIFGTDDRGRDVFTRLLYGFKYSISYAVAVWFISLSIGTILGGVMGFFGGKVDFIGQRIVEVLSTVPQFFLLIILISIFTPSLGMLILISCVFAWINISYYVRGEFLKNRNREFVEAAKSLGASNMKIIFKHILPNSLTPIITFAPFTIAAEIVGLAALDYLGFGLQVPTPSWGELLAQAQKNYTIAWWLAFYPSLALFIVLTLLNLIGQGVRDAMDPNMT